MINLFETTPISGVTINTIPLPEDFRIVLYAVSFCTLVTTTLYLFKKNGNYIVAFKKAVVTTFFVAAVFYGTYSETLWLTWFFNDLKQYGRLNTDEKLLKMSGAIYDFPLKVKNYIDEDYILYTSDSMYGEVPLKTQYYLLPAKRVTGESNSVVLLADRDSWFDGSTGVLTRGKERFENMELILRYGDYAALLKKKKL